MTSAIDLNLERREEMPIPDVADWPPSDTLRRQLFIRCLARMVRIAMATERADELNQENYEVRERTFS